MSEAALCRLSAKVVLKIKRLLRSNCDQGNSYDGHFGEICGKGVWGKTDVEVWYPME